MYMYLAHVGYIYPILFNELLSLPHVHVQGVKQIGSVRCPEHIELPNIGI